jgi:anti-sigma factor RsiW
MHPDIDLLLRYTDGELSAGECHKLEKHLEKCVECRAEADRLRAAEHSDPATPVAASDLLAGIRQWTAQRPATDGDVKSRMATELDPYLGSAGSATVLGRASSNDKDLLPAIESVLTDFLGRRAVGQLVDRIVEHTIMRF